MADDNKAGTNLASSGVVVAALAAMGVYYFHHQAPLVDLRPTVSSVHEQAASQTIYARLWQDPFAAVEKSDLREIEKQCQQNPNSNVHCKPPEPPPLDEPPPVGEDAKTLILGVMVPGGPYQDDAERRGRTRYAVLAGLERAGFVPKDASHIGFFLWTPKGETAPSQQCSMAWLDHDTITTAASSERTERTTVPYEWFITPEGQRSLVLWLNQDTLREQPLQKLSQLIQFIRGQQCDQKNGEYVKIIGPYSSDMLEDMVREKAKVHKVRNVNKWPDLKGVQFYAYAASAPDSLLLKVLPPDDRPPKPNDTVQDYFKDSGFALQRTVATDDTLTQGIATELQRRHIDPRNKPTDHIALISEWDTAYGQFLPQAVEAKFACPDASPDCRDGGEHPLVYKFTYLRGLDGLLPSAKGKEDQNQDKTTISGEKQSSTTDFFKIEADTQSLERPIGQSQFDYLRRISERLSEIDKHLRKRGHKIKAIGILGSDVFDKLLILRALRPAFPEALFFTTDFYEAFTIKSELPYTRNLLISSSFGPNLSEKWQGASPPFRDTYETSAFLATLLAIGDPSNNKFETPESVSNYVAKQLAAPRIFEIKRSGDVLPFAWEFKGPAPSDRSPPNHDREHEHNPLVAEAGHPTEGRSTAVGWGQNSTKERGAKEWPCWNGDDLSNCEFIQPVDLEAQTKLSEKDRESKKIIEELFPTYEKTSRWLLTFGLALGAFFGLLLLRFFQRLRVEIGLAAGGLALGAVTCVLWEPFAQLVTSHGDGEPLVMLGGVSVWPTVLLRICGIILSIDFIWRAENHLFKNLQDEISRRMELNPVPAPFELRSAWKKIRILARHKRYLWRNIKSIFDYSLSCYSRSQDSYLEVEPIWRAYVIQERFWPRACRAIIYTSGMILFALIVLVPMFGWPIDLARGNLAHDIYVLTTFFAVFFMLFLTYFVFDATLFCLLFVNKLRSAKPKWPEETLGAYNGRLRLQTKRDDDLVLVHDWINLDFVAKRTRCIGALIYLPFVLIALLIVSRSAIFANFPPSLTILIAQGIGLSVVFGCALMLWWAAKVTRDKAKQDLADGLIRAKDSEGNVCLVGQLERLLSRVDQLKEGAFSPLSQQPLVRAVLLPLGSAGWVLLVENGLFPGL